MSLVCPRCSELLPDDAGFCPFDGVALPKSTDGLIGRIIASRYRLTKRLGAGGMSVVYLARHELISRLSAIKILRPELSRVPEHRERFLREARAVNRINHENIVEITDVGESDGIAYLVMEYIEGESLLTHIQRGPMPWRRGVQIAMQVASALARTHQAGVIHRDLKPENILLVPSPAAAPRARSEDGERVKLTDFGIAKMAGEPTLTLNTQLFGTPGYIAPEYVDGLAIDGRADIYSLAVVLYETVTARLPFDARGQSELLLKPLTSAPIPPSRRVDGLPRELEDVLLRCLARDRDVRPHDAFAMHDALAEILARHASRPSAAAPREVGAGEEGTAGREPLATQIDVRRPEAPVGEEPSPPAVTGGLRARWVAALTELESRIATARAAGGESARVAGHAAELALVAGEMLPRLDRAGRLVAELQLTVDRLEADGRDFRASLGNAIDVLVHDRSRERAHLDAVRARRASLAPTSVDPGAAPVGPWEAIALESEERRVGGIVDDLRFQVDTLQRQLDARNEAHELALVRACGKLEGALSALRRLASEIEGTIDEATALLDR